MSDTEQSYRIKRRDNGAGFPVAWVIDHRGVERRASEAEAWLWDRLQEAKGLPEEAQQRHEASEFTPPETPKSSRPRR